MSSLANTPRPTRGGTNSLEETIAVTPIPQASSTVERQDAVSVDYEKPLIDLSIESNNSVDPTRLISAVGDIQNLAEKYKNQKSLDTSDASSLGILNNSFSDFSVDGDDINYMMSKLGDMSFNEGASLNTTSKSSVDTELLKLSNGKSFNAMSDTDIDLELRLQRALAQSLLDRSNDISELHEANISKHSLVNQESEDSKTKDMEFMIQTKKNGRSATDALIETEKVSGVSSQSSHWGDTLKNPFSDSSVEMIEDFQSMFRDFSAEKFISADAVIDKLKADEIEWKKEFADIGANSVQYQKIDLSNFSGLMDDAEITVRSSIFGEGVKTKKKLCADEFFGLKTYETGSLQGDKLGRSERPNFGNEITSPVQGRIRRPLIDLTSDQELSICDVSECEDKLEDQMSVSFPSLTAIQHILSDEKGDSPGTIVNNIMKFSSKKAKRNILRETSNCNSLPKEPVKMAISGSANTSKTSGLEDISDFGNCSEHDLLESSVEIVLDNSHKMRAKESFNSTIVLEEMDDLKENELDHYKYFKKTPPVSQSSFRSDMSESELNRHSNKSKGNKNVKVQNPSISLKDKNHTESDVIVLDESSIIETGTSEDCWVNVEAPGKEIGTYVGIEVELLLPVNCLNDRWLRYDLELKTLACNEMPNADAETLAQVQLPEPGILGPHQRGDLKVLFTPLVAGHLTTEIIIKLEDIITKSSQSSVGYYNVISEVPEITVLVNEEEEEE